jgi:hypothetical protein
VSMGINKARHQRPAAEIHPLRVRRHPAASLDYLRDPPILYEDSHSGAD